ncbi:MAG: hypothetical protein ACJ71W_09060 [Terriglobales bacterium]
MRHSIAMLFFCCVLASNIYSQTPIQLTTVPPKPTCTIFLQNGSCADLWRAYNQAVAQRQNEEIQLYVSRQKELASAAATAPLQQQIDDLTKLSSDQQARLKKQQEQMKADAAAALEAKAAAHEEGMQNGMAIGAGGMLVLVLVILVIRRLSRNFTVVKKSHVASA